MLLAIAVIKLKKKKKRFSFLHTISVIQYFSRPSFFHTSMSFSSYSISHFCSWQEQEKGEEFICIMNCRLYRNVEEVKNSQTIEIALNILLLTFTCCLDLACHQDDMEWYLARNERRMRNIILRKESFLMSSSSLIIIISCLQPAFIF